MEFVYSGENEISTYCSAGGACCAPCCRVPAGADVKIEFNVLGPPELKAAGRDAVKVYPQLWCVLVSLLLKPNIAVPAEALIDHLWDDNPTPKARTMIRSYIWRIDRLLSKAQGDAVEEEEAG